MNYGKTSSGVVAKPKSVLLRDMQLGINEGLGPTDTSEETPIGQVNKVLVKPYAELWQALAGMESRLDPDSAEGYYLDVVLSYNGMTRLPATESTSIALLRGTIGATIPAITSTALHAITGSVFILQEPVTIDSSALSRCAIRFDSPLATLAFDMEIRITPEYGVTQSVTLPTSYTVYTSEEMANAFRSQIESISTSVGVQNVELMESDTGLLDTVVFETVNPYGVFGVEIEVLSSTYIEIYEAWSTGLFKAQNTGAIVVAPNTLTTIKSGTPNWFEVNNRISGQTGSDIEKDEDARSRRKRSFHLSGGATPPAIVAKIMQLVDGVTYCRVYNNRKDYIDDNGIPPHSVHCIVEGGEIGAIAETMYTSCISSGIGTHGNIAHTVSDGAIVRFSRPVILYGFIRITINTKNDEEVFPHDAYTRIRQSVWERAVAKSAMGADIIAQDYIGPVYSAVTGLQNISIEISVTSDPSVDPSTTVGSQNDITNPYSSGWDTEKIAINPNNRVEWRDALINPSNNRIIIVDNAL